MASTDQAGQVRGLRVRVAVLSSTGVPEAGAANGYVSGAFVLVRSTPRYDDGEAVGPVRNAAGTVCVEDRARPTLLGGIVRIQLCSPDPNLVSMLENGTILTDGGATVGSNTSRTHTTNDRKLSIEVFSKAVIGGAQAGTDPYWWNVWPLVEDMRRIEDEEHSSGTAVNPVFEGFANENPLWGNGPWNDWTLASNTWRLGPMRTDTIPATSADFTAVPAQV